MDIIQGNENNNISLKLLLCEDYDTAGLIMVLCIPRMVALEFSTVYTSM